MKKRTKKEQDKINLCGEGKKFVKGGKQPSAEAKSQGWLKKRKEENILLTLRTEIQKYGILQKVVKTINGELAEGSVKNALELLKMAKENEAQEQKISGNLEIQKVYITAEEQKETLEHIKNVIDEQPE